MDTTQHCSLDSAGTLRQAAIDCAVRSADRWSDDLLEASRRLDWSPIPTHARLGPVVLVALDAEHDRRLYGTDTAAAWGLVFDEIVALPDASLRDLAAWATLPGMTDDPPGLRCALACVAAAARVVEPTDGVRIIADLEASLTGASN